MSFFNRVIVGGGLGVLGGLVGGPALAYAGWKLGGTLATGNPLHLIPGAGLLADGMDIASVGVEAMSLEASDIVANDVVGNSAGEALADGYIGDPAPDDYGRVDPDFYNRQKRDFWDNPKDYWHDPK